MSREKPAGSNAPVTYRWPITVPKNPLTVSQNHAQSVRRMLKLFSVPELANEFRKDFRGKIGNAAVQLAISGESKMTVKDRLTKSLEQVFLVVFGAANKDTHPVTSLSREFELNERRIMHLIIDSYALFGDDFRIQERREDRPHVITSHLPLYTTIIKSDFDREKRVRRPDLLPGLIKNYADTGLWMMQQIAKDNSVPWGMRRAELSGYAGNLVRGLHLLTVMPEVLDYTTLSAPLTGHDRT